MKIVFIGGRDIHKLGGIENYMYNLATELVKIGHEPIVFCESDHNGEETVNGFRVIHQKGPKSVFICKIWLGLKATVRALRMKNVAFIHYNAWPPAVPAILLARLANKSAAIMGHGHGWQRTKYSPFQQKIMKFMEWAGVSMAKYRFMCSEAQTCYFKEKHGYECSTLPTAINLPEKELKSDILNRFNLKSKKYFFYLARLVQDKNPDYLIRAFQESGISDYKLVIAGNNPAAPDFVDKLHELGKNNENIIFTDAVYGADKDCLLRNAFVFCIPSTIEGLSISLLEAMSYRIPVIASDIPANKEVLEPDKAIWVRAESVSDLVAAFRHAIECETEFNELTEYNYKKVADSYTWPKIAALYNRLLIKFGVAK